MYCDKCVDEFSTDFIVKTRKWCGGIEPWGYFWIYDCIPSFVFSFHNTRRPSYTKYETPCKAIPTSVSCVNSQKPRDSLVLTKLLLERAHATNAMVYNILRLFRWILRHVRNAPHTHRQRSTEASSHWWICCKLVCLLGLTGVAMRGSWLCVCVMSLCACTYLFVRVSVCLYFISGERVTRCDIRMYGNMVRPNSVCKCSCIAAM